MEITLREATETDKDRIYRLYIDSMRGYIESIWGWEEGWQQDDFDKKWEALSTQVIDLDSKFIGYMQTEEREDSLYISMIILSPEHRSQGFGTLILNDLLQRSSRGEKKLRLQVFMLNKKAIAFYSRLGFRTVAEETDTVIMERGPEQR